MLKKKNSDQENYILEHVMWVCGKNEECMRQQIINLADGIIMSGAFIKSARPRKYYKLDTNLFKMCGFVNQIMSSKRNVIIGLATLMVLGIVTLIVCAFELNWFGTKVGIKGTGGSIVTITEKTKLKVEEEDEWEDDPPI